MKKNNLGLLVLIAAVTVGSIIYSEQSNSEDGNPSQWSMNCFHHDTFIGVSNNLIGCLNQVPPSQMVPLPHYHSPKTHTNPMDCINTEPFN